MKLAYIAGSPLPSRIASSIQVAKMCQAFADSGHEVLLLTPDRPEVDRNVDDVHAFYGVRHNFEIRRLRWRIGRLGAYSYAVASARAARRFGAQIVYGRYAAGVLAAASFRMACIYEAHVFPVAAGRMDSRIHRALIRSPRLERLVVISRALQDAYQEHFGLPEHRVLVAHDAADTPRPDSGRRMGPEDRLQVGYVGNLYPGKGIELILALADRCPWADFHVVGDMGSDEATWAEKARRNLTFHGFIPPVLTDAVRHGCDVLLAPYQDQVFGYGGREIGAWMSPLKIFEYLAAGRAILASDLPVLREVLEDGQTARLCDPNVLSSWVEALVSLRDDSVLRARLGHEAQRVFLARHTWLRRAELVLAGVAPEMRAHARG